MNVTDEVTRPSEDMSEEMSFSKLQKELFEKLARTHTEMDQSINHAAKEELRTAIHTYPLIL